MAKEAYYFSHDSNARHDPKITAMRGVYGSEGYGWYWMLVEMMRESEGYKLDMQGKYVWNAFALQLNCDSRRIEEFVNDCISEFSLFESDERCFWSPSLLRRMDIREQKSEVRKKAAKARWDKEKRRSDDGTENADHMQMHSNSNANGMQGKERKVKERESKGKEIKDITTTSEAPPPNPFSLFESEGFGMISSIIAERIGSMIDDYGERWVCEAMKAAVVAGKRNLGYVDGILKRYKSSGVDEPWNEPKPDRQRNAPAGRVGKPQLPIVENTPAAVVSEDEMEELRRLARKIDGGGEDLPF